MKTKSSILGSQISTRNLLSIKDITSNEVVELLLRAWLLQNIESVHHNNALSSNATFCEQNEYIGKLIDNTKNNNDYRIFAGKHILIVGDILHSRVARSNLELITKLGGEVTFIAPPTLIPSDLTALPNVKINYDFDDALKKSDFDAIMLLRIQAERMLGGEIGPNGSAKAGFFPSLEDYKLRYCLTNERASLLSDNIPILHPAPINRGLDIASEVADSKQSLINHQIRNGVYLRMSALQWLLNDSTENDVEYLFDYLQKTVNKTDNFNNQIDNEDLVINKMLSGKTIVNLFFENSTRTRISFEVAIKKLGANVMNFAASGSSVSKGESLKDTIKTLYAMGIDGVVIRHSDSGAAYRLANSGWINVPVLNAGDGTHAHPTQALLDAFTLMQHFASFSSLYNKADQYGKII